MCGIICAVSKKNIVEILFSGLLRLEYRGYDSSGLAVIDKKNRIHRIRRLGKVNNLIKDIKKLNKVNGNIGIAHTRWATHGEPSENNAHPHRSKNIILVHNGIIENYKTIRTFLVNNGYKFYSDTDTEVVAHLIHWEQKHKQQSLFNILLNITSKLNGTYSMVVLDSDDPGKLVAIKYGSPLVIGCGENENFIASDQLALSHIVKKFIYLEEGDVAEIHYNKILIFNNHILVNRKIIKSRLKYHNVNKGKFNHYMEKEIYEQPIVIKKTIFHYSMVDQINLFKKNRYAKKMLSKVKNIKIVACGTSYNSGMVAKYWFESLINIHCDVEIASEFRYRKTVVLNNTLFMVLSQSGETADTLAALRLSKNLGYMLSLAICNVESSSLIREADLNLITKAGIEIGVASTKAFTTQLTLILMLIENIGRYKKININITKKIFYCLQKLPKRIDQVLSYNNLIKKIAYKLFDKNNLIFIGRGNQYPIAMEGALKLKEISYIHAEAYAAGELKHGPLALIDENIPVIVLAPNNHLINKIKLNVEEIYARKGMIYLFTDKYTKFSNRKRLNIINLPFVEDIISPIFYVIPLQLLSYYIALLKCTDIDQPRNLAKSVTVE